MLVVPLETRHVRAISLSYDLSQKMQKAALAGQRHQKARSRGKLRDPEGRLSKRRGGPSWQQQIELVSLRRALRRSPPSARDIKARTKADFETAARFRSTIFEALQESDVIFYDVFSKCGLCSDEDVDDRRESASYAQTVSARDNGPTISQGMHEIQRALGNHEREGRQRSLEEEGRLLPAQAEHKSCSQNYGLEFDQDVAAQINRPNIDFTAEFGPIFVRQCRELACKLIEGENAKDKAEAQALNAGVSTDASSAYGYEANIQSIFGWCELVDLLVPRLDQKGILDWLEADIERPEYCSSLLSDVGDAWSQTHPTGLKKPRTLLQRKPWIIIIHSNRRMIIKRTGNGSESQSHRSPKMKRKIDAPQGPSEDVSIVIEGRMEKVSEPEEPGVGCKPDVSNEPLEKGAVVTHSRTRNVPELEQRGKYQTSESSSDPTNGAIAVTANNKGTTMESSESEEDQGSKESNEAFGGEMTDNRKPRKINQPGQAHVGHEKTDTQKNTTSPTTASEQSNKRIEIVNATADGERGTPQPILPDPTPFSVSSSEQSERTSTMSECKIGTPRRILLSGTSPETPKERLGTPENMSARQTFSKQTVPDASKDQAGTSRSIPPANSADASHELLAGASALAGEKRQSSDGQNSGNHNAPVKDGMPGSTHPPAGYPDTSEKNIGTPRGSSLLTLESSSNGNGKLVERNGILLEKYQAKKDR
ncbi:hypothetical protein K469DRAFT_689216 [Zopfia rhizophila CBS 207.26]|uniref:Uncharacterized protein n=1 Tax=Zopfia rhizophila CBS 207.26 TaxID=1314779 RepID=A0A6A6ET22_9PEZI|nr:hypothetical protein K469DRAFT_689216 [Zopfia rhizophila CBS 207.26]